MKTLSPLIFLILLLSACANPSEQTQTQTPTVPTPTLSPLWASDTLLRTPESVLYDQERELIYVANVNENPWEKDGNGFISTMDLEGNITELEWVSGFNGPKGMGILGNSLFVADIDEIVEIDNEQAAIIKRYPVAGTPTLNDITIGGSSVFVSGSDSNTIFEYFGHSFF